MQVTAMTWEDQDRELPPREVRGELAKRYVPTLDYTQYWVNGVQVNPSTVRKITTNAFCATGAGGGQDNSCGKITPKQRAVVDKLASRAESLRGKATATDRMLLIGDMGAFTSAQEAAFRTRLGIKEGQTLKDYLAGEGAGLSSTSPQKESSGEEHARLVQTAQKLAGEKHNFIHLGDLRDAHPNWSKGQFDAALDAARRQGKITLSAAEGRHGSTVRDRDSAIYERDDVTGRQDRMLLYASLKGPTGNVFCPTGPGGGKDPTCGKSGKTSSALKAVKEATGYGEQEIREALTRRAGPDKSNRAVVRAKVTDAILKGGHSVPDAINHLFDGGGTKDSAQLAANLTVGNKTNVVKELSTVPAYDLAVLSGIEAKAGKVSGEAVCNMASRKITVGDTTRPGSYRHELGHALRAALGGESYQGKTESTKAIAAEYNKMKARVKADPPSHSTALSHDEYEIKYGAVGRRCLDNWEEHFAEHYRLYHREVYRDRHEGGGGKFLAQYRERHPGMARIFDAHYTAALMGQELGK